MLWLIRLSSGPLLCRGGCLKLNIDPIHCPGRRSFEYPLHSQRSRKRTSALECMKPRYSWWEPWQAAWVSEHFITTLFWLIVGMAQWARRCRSAVMTRLNWNHTQMICSVDWRIQGMMHLLPRGLLFPNTASEEHSKVHLHNSSFGSSAVSFVTFLELG